MVLQHFLISCTFHGFLHCMIMSLARYPQARLHVQQFQRSSSYCSWMINIIAWAACSLARSLVCWGRSTTILQTDQQNLWAFGWTLIFSWEMIWLLFADGIKTVVATEERIHACTRQTTYIYTTVLRLVLWEHLGIIMRHCCWPCCGTVCRGFFCVLCLLPNKKGMSLLMVLVDGISTRWCMRLEWRTEDFYCTSVAPLNAHHHHQQYHQHLHQIIVQNFSSSSSSIRSECLQLNQSIIRISWKKKSTTV